MLLNTSRDDDAEVDSYDEDCEDEEDSNEEGEEDEGENGKQEQDLMVVCGGSAATSAEQPGAPSELYNLLKNSLDLVRQALVAIRSRLH